MNSVNIVWINCVAQVLLQNILLTELIKKYVTSLLNPDIFFHVHTT
jgi:hypothetical protein